VFVRCVKQSDAPMWSEKSRKSRKTHFDCAFVTRLNALIVTTSLHLVLLFYFWLIWRVADFIRGQRPIRSSEAGMREESMLRRCPICPVFPIFSSFPYRVARTLLALLKFLLTGFSDLYLDRYRSIGSLILQFCWKTPMAIFDAEI